MFEVVTGKVTVPAVPAVNVPLCEPTVTVFAPAIVSVKFADCVLSMVRRNVEVVPATVCVLPESVNVPLPFAAMVTLPETDTPLGRPDTVAVYVPAAMFDVVTGKVTVPAVPAVNVPL